MSEEWFFNPRNKSQKVAIMRPTEANGIERIVNRRWRANARALKGTFGEQAEDDENCFIKTKVSGIIESSKNERYCDCLEGRIH